MIALIVVQVPLIAGDSVLVLSDEITYFPDDAWTATTPDEQGMSSTVLDEMMQFINDSEAAIRGLVVTRNGYIVKERYWSYNNENSTRHIFSCTKSFTGALVGIAIKEGFIDNVSQKVLDFFPHMTIDNMDARKEAMTLEHVLTMTTGLDWNEWNISYSHPDNMYNQMFAISGNAIQFFLDLPTVYDPGEHWVYTTGASHLLSAIIQETTGMSTRDFAEEYLFDPLNMTIGGWGVDIQGIHIGGTLLYVTPRAMAKLGLLYLNNGTWDGQEIIPEEYVTQSIYPHTGALYLDPDYGYQWWIDSDAGQYSARGSEGQYIHVLPEYNVVISITANADEPGENVEEDIVEFVIDSILEGPDGPPPTGDFVFPIIGISAVVIVAVIGFYIRKSRYVES